MAYANGGSDTYSIESDALTAEIQGGQSTNYNVQGGFTNMQSDGCADGYQIIPVGGSWENMGGCTVSEFVSSSSSSSSSSSTASSTNETGGGGSGGGRGGATANTSPVLTKDTTTTQLNDEVLHEAVPEATPPETTLAPIASVIPVSPSQITATITPTTPSANTIQFITTDGVVTTNAAPALEIFRVAGPERRSLSETGFMDLGYHTLGDGGFIKGFAAPFAEVTAVFRSTVRTVTVQADGTGYFEIPIPTELEPGDHTVTIHYVADGITSTKQTFALHIMSTANAEQTDPLHAAAAQNELPMLLWWKIIFGSSGICLIAAFFIQRSRKILLTR